MCDFYDRTVGPLARYDASHNTRLVETLEAFFANLGNVSQAAESLFLHRNSLLYRLERIREITEMDLDDADALAEMAAGLEINFDEGRAMVDGADLTDVIRTEPVSAASSRVSALEPVRAAILDLQRNMRRPPGLVADGRDMGTVVFQDAELKVYLDASAEIRAERRYNQLKNKGLDVSFRALLANLEERDARDKARAVSPLVPAEDALIIDSTNLSIEEVLEMVLSEVEARHLMRE
jgi:cytidylate kinase